MTNDNNILMIAPCGMNCSYCFAYLRKKNKCTGCRGCDENKPITRVICKIKSCEYFLNNNALFCYECNDYPCKALTHLDKRYRTRYDLSLIENLEKIKRNGIKKFIQEENKKWQCPSCGGAVCLHTKQCIQCSN